MTTIQEKMQSTIRRLTSKLVFLAVCTPRFIYDAYEDLDDESMRP